ncbi:unnamed protein product [Timema podura]|uniref:Fibronectin type-III domain-containing protein n=1 Tax=Timema podura TaxID=61482 RepID=A0ABN7PJ49_TIMPD|nr:unnamed protein product [Timema podura]
MLKVPEVPYGLKVLDKSGRSVQLSWAAPYDGNSPIKRYIIEYKISKASLNNVDLEMVIVSLNSRVGLADSVCPSAWDYN